VRAVDTDSASNVASMMTPSRCSATALVASVATYHGAGGNAHEAAGDAANHDGVHRAVASGADEQEVELLGRLGEDVRWVADGENRLGPGLGLDPRDDSLECLGGARVQRVVV
jgi:hypothetical protein